MSSKDEELQRAIENNLGGEKSLDAKAYQTIFEALKKDPYALPNNFADIVIQRAEAKKRGFSADLFWLGAGLIFFLVIAAFLISMIKFKLTFGPFKFVSQNGVLIVLSIVLVCVFQWVDKTIVQKKIKTNTSLKFS